jgi:hypothetical protein
MITTAYTCSICKDIFTLETGESLKESPEGEVLCNDCECEHYHYACTWCDDCEDVAHQHRAIVVWDAAEAGVMLTGLYLIRERPYYWSRILEGGLYPHAVQWLGWMPLCPWLFPYPTGHLCRSCLRHFQAQGDLLALQGMWMAQGGGDTR